MITVVSPKHALHNPPHEFYDGRLIPPYESPARVDMIVAAIERAGLGPLLPPREFGVAPLHAVHESAYLEYLESAYERWVAAGGNPAAVLPSTLAVRWMSQPCLHPLVAPGYYCFDLSAPIAAGTYQAARASADTALTGAALLLEGQPLAYALCRPPGHHAGTDLYGGYCYLNNAAIAAAYLAATGERVADNPHNEYLLVWSQQGLPGHHGQRRGVGELGPTPNDAREGPAWGDQVRASVELAAVRRAHHVGRAHAGCPVEQEVHDPGQVDVGRLPVDGGDRLGCTDRDPVVGAVRIDQVGDLVDGQTGGQYAAQVDQAQQFAKDQVDQNAG